MEPIQMNEAAPKRAKMMLCVENSTSTQVVEEIRRATSATFSLPDAMWLKLREEVSLQGSLLESLVTEAEEFPTALKKCVESRLSYELIQEIGGALDTTYDILDALWLNLSGYTTPTDTPIPRFYGQT